MSSTADFLVNLRLHLIDLSRRLEQDSSDDVADYVLYRLQQVARHLSRIAASATGNVFEEVQLSLGWVENEDLRPKTQKRRPPSKSLINI